MGKCVDTSSPLPGGSPLLAGSLLQRSVMELNGLAEGRESQHRELWSCP